MLPLVVAMGLTTGPVMGDPAVHVAPGQLVAVDQHRLHIHCTGEGSPTVVLEAGVGGNYLHWSRVQPQIAETTRVCSYDRGGYGWSEAGPQPRISVPLARELHTLLDNAGEAGPYVLVGHSFGGYIVRAFTHLFPDDAAGLVLVDAAHEQQVERFRREVGIDIAPQPESRVHYRPTLPDNLPASAQAEARYLAHRHKAFRAVRSELLRFRHSASQAGRNERLPEIPLRVLTRGDRAWPPGHRGDRMEGLWMELQQELAQLNGRSRHVVVEGSGHYIHLDRPDAVVTAIREILDQVNGR